MTRTGTFAHAHGLGQLAQLADGQWSAAGAGVSGIGPTPVHAILNAVGPPTGMTLPTVLMQIDLTEEELVACGEAGLPFTYGIEWYILPTIDDLEELGCNEHPDYQEVATTHGAPQSGDEIDLDDNDFLIARVGRIGRQYFELDEDTQQCTCLGWFDSHEAAARAAAGADFVYRLQ